MLENLDIKRTDKNTKDEYLSFVEEISKKEFEFASGLVFTHLSNKEDSKQNKENSATGGVHESWGVFEKEILAMQHELQEVVKLFLYFYTTEVNKISRLVGETLTPMSINHAILALITRIKRMMCVLEPNITINSFFDKKSGFHYQMIKGNWITDEGKKNRGLSRNIANAEASINDIVMKFFKLNRKDVIVYEPESSEKGTSDLMIASGSDKWAVQTSNLNREDFIRIYAMFELWKMYKEKYKLIGTK